MTLNILCNWCSRHSMWILFDMSEIERLSSSLRQPSTPLPYSRGPATAERDKRSSHIPLSVRLSANGSHQDQSSSPSSASMSPTSSDGRSPSLTKAIVGRTLRQPSQEGDRQPLYGPHRQTSVESNIPRLISKPLPTAGAGAAQTELASKKNHLSYLPKPIEIVYKAVRDYRPSLFSLSGRIKRELQLKEGDTVKPLGKFRICGRVSKLEKKTKSKSCRIP